jgi:hypothetical protein
MQKPKTCRPATQPSTSDTAKASDRTTHPTETPRQTAPILQRFRQRKIGVLARGAPPQFQSTFIWGCTAKRLRRVWTT